MSALSTSDTITLAVKRLDCPKYHGSLHRHGMFYNEHGVPHFHGVYGEHEISVEVKTRVVRGDFPPRALQHVLEWARLYEEELLENWKLARKGEPLGHMAPLE